MSAPCNPATYSFSTAGIAQDQRFEAWREETSAMFEMSSPGPLNVSYDSSFDFTALGELMFGGRSWLQPAGTVVHGMARSARKIRADGLDAYYLQLQVGETIQGYAGRTASQVNPGDICVLDLASPFDLEVTTGDTICMVVPRDSLPSCVAELHGLSLSGGMANILSDYLISLRKNMPSLSLDEFAHASHATKNVLHACLAPTQERFRHAETELNAVLVNRIKRYIDKNLLSPELGPNTICREMAISRAKLYRLFEPSGGVTREIQRKRLLRARTRLLDTAAPRKRISEIAWEHGFASDSHFSRVFNKTFGCSPRDMAGLKGDRHTTRASEDAHTRHANLAEWMRSIAVA